MLKRTLLFTAMLGVILGTATAVADSPPGGGKGTLVHPGTVVSAIVSPKATIISKEGVTTKKISLKDPVLSLNKITFATAELRQKHLEKLIKAVAAVEDRGGKPFDRRQCDQRWTERCDKFKTDADPQRSRKAYRHRVCLRKWKRCYKRDDRWKRKRRIIAEAALNAQELTGVDATFMIAVGRMESDFRNLVLINPACKYGHRNYSCHADCGMTQHHVRGSLKHVQQMCKKLARSPKRSFRKSAEEFARHVKYCNDPKQAKRHSPTRRCILNRYNQGTVYKRRERCPKCWINPKRFWSPESYRWALVACRKTRRKCRNKAAYWKKLTCFEYGARHNIRSKRSCRRCHSITKIRTRFYETPQTDLALTFFLFKLTRRK